MRKCGHTPALNNGEQNVFTQERDRWRERLQDCSSIWKFNPQRRKPDKRWAISTPKNRKTTEGIRQLLAASELAECFSRIRLQVALRRRNALEKIQKRKNQLEAIFTQQ